MQGRTAQKILCDLLPDLVEATLVASALDLDAIKRHVELTEDQDALRGQLEGAGLVAFVPDGAVLARASGASDAPMDFASAVKFQSPPEYACEFTLPNRGPVAGMGVRKGVTLIVGGGFHGKSTLLQALEMGIYPKVGGDGRELVATVASAVKVRAEDGRPVANVNISPFIGNLPFGKTTQDFSTADASGSTSQAANIVEALEVGATALLIDEDTAATNFMIRDQRMQALVAGEKEPIRPASRPAPRRARPPPPPSNPRLTPARLPLEPRSSSARSAPCTRRGACPPSSSSAAPATTSRWRTTSS